MQQAEAVVGIVRALLGEALIGAFLHGSAVLGGLRPGSDIDILSVTTRPTTDDEKRGLIGRLLSLSGRADPTRRTRSVELTMVVQSDVRPWRYPPRLDFQYGEWWRREFEQGVIAPWTSPNPDLAILLTAVLRGNRAIFGPPPEEILDPVPPQDLRCALLDSIPGLLADIDGDEANVILTFARIWMTLVTGEIAPKDVAADWALARLPGVDRAALAHARAIYLGHTPDVWDDLIPRVRPLVDAIQREIRAASAACSDSALLALPQ